jgi:hypothetical protein
LIDAAIGLPGSIEKHTGGPAFIQARCSDPDCFPVAGATLDWIGRQGANQWAEQGHSEEFRLGHERHWSAQGMAKKGWIEMGTMVGYHHQ